MHGEAGVYLPTAGGINLFYRPQPPVLRRVVCAGVQPTQRRYRRPGQLSPSPWNPLHLQNHLQLQLLHQLLSLLHDGSELPATAEDFVQ